MLDDASDVADPLAHRLLLINRVCEEFTLPPSAALREIDDDEEGLILDLLHVRSYIRCKEAYDLPAGDERDKRLVPWQDSTVLRDVEDNAREITRAHMPKLGKKKGQD